MERTVIQFRVRDLLLATSLVATYLAGIGYAIAHLKPGELYRESFGLVSTLVVFVAAIEVTIRIARHRHDPHQFSLPLSLPWIPMFAAAAILFGISLAAGRLMDGAFFVISVPFLTLVLMVLVHRNVYLNADGILFLFLPWRWSQVELLESGAGTLKICLKPKWLRLTIDVPVKDREGIMDLVNGADSSHLH